MLKTLHKSCIVDDARNCFPCSDSYLKLKNIKLYKSWSFFNNKVFIVLKIFTKTINYLMTSKNVLQIIFNNGERIIIFQCIIQVYLNNLQWRLYTFLNKYCKNIELFGHNSLLWYSKWTYVKNTVFFSTLAKHWRIPLTRSCNHYTTCSTFFPKILDAFIGIWRTVSIITTCTIGDDWYFCKLFFIRNNWWIYTFSST